ncbi:hypothetical protein [Sphingopyxis sp. Geo48]|uniref:hypothetical protein n=1 Tax=Sphingopyxis sp. Geo48 TaxID=545241 RepID=UPI00195FF433|nr:hypothetical protein [Sphingopyxis sp. Geo48]
MSLQDLTNEIPSDEYLNEFRTHASAELDRGTVIMASAMVEQSLEHALRRSLTHLTAEEISAWFDGPMAPFATFDAKIKLGRALKGNGVYDGGVERKLDLIRRVRNAFAHRSMPLDLSHPALSATYNELLSDLGEWPLERREVFAGYCLAVTRTLRDIKATAD